MTQSETIATTIIPMADIELNKGQIPGLPKNPRFIKNEKFDRLKDSITENPEMLALRELLVFPFDDKFVLVGGNMRYRAMKELGYTEAPCKVIPSDTSVEQLKAYTVKDNASFGEWDFGMIDLDWDAGMMAHWGVDIPELEEAEEEPEASEDDYCPEGELSRKTKSKTGDVWALGDHRVMCGDATVADDIRVLMDGAMADLVLTDPPYNIGYSKGDHDAIANDLMSDSSFESFLTSAFKAMEPYMKPGCPFYVWHASWAQRQVENALNAVGLEARQQIIWAKNNLCLTRQDYQWKHEPCFYGWKAGAAHYFTTRRDMTTVQEMLQDKDPDKMTKAELLQIVKAISSDGVPTTVIKENKPQKSEEHPSMKPLKLMGRLISNSSRKGELILDTFGGSGSTLMAAEQLERRCYTMELEPKYVDVIINRWEEYTGQKAVLIGKCL